MRILLKRCDVLRQTFHCGGPGGQYQNKTESGVRYIHLPTGERAEGRSERSQHQNDRLAWALLQAKLDRRAEDQRTADRAKAYAEKPEAAFGHAIRTYRLCGSAQEAVDHRTGYSTSTRAALNGRIDGFLKRARS